MGDPADKAVLDSVLSNVTIPDWARGELGLNPAMGSGLASPSPVSQPPTPEAGEESLATLVSQVAALKKLEKTIRLVRGSKEKIIALLKRKKKSSGGGAGGGGGTPGGAGSATLPDAASLASTPTPTSQVSTPSPHASRVSPAAELIASGSAVPTSASASHPVSSSSRGRAPHRRGPPGPPPHQPPLPPPLPSPTVIPTDGSGMPSTSTSAMPGSTSPSGSVASAEDLSESDRSSAGRRASWSGGYAERRLRRRSRERVQVLNLPRSANASPVPVPSTTPTSAAGAGPPRQVSPSSAPATGASGEWSPRRRSIDGGLGLPRGGGVNVMPPPQLPTFVQPEGGPFTGAPSGAAAAPGGYTSTRLPPRSPHSSNSAPVLQTSPSAPQRRMLEPPPGFKPPGHLRRDSDGFSVGSDGSTGSRGIRMSGRDGQAPPPMTVPMTRAAPGGHALNASPGVSPLSHLSPHDVSPSRYAPVPNPYSGKAGTYPTPITSSTEATLDRDRGFFSGETPGSFGTPSPAWLTPGASTVTPGGVDSGMGGGTGGGSGMDDVTPTATAVAAAAAAAAAAGVGVLAPPKGMASRPRPPGLSDLGSGDRAPPPQTSATSSVGPGTVGSGSGSGSGNGSPSDSKSLPFFRFLHASSTSPDGEPPTRSPSS